MESTSFRHYPFDVIMPCPAQLTDNRGEVLESAKILIEMAQLVQDGAIAEASLTKILAESRGQLHSKQFIFKVPPLALRIALLPDKRLAVVDMIVCLRHDTLGDIRSPDVIKAAHADQHHHEWRQLSKVGRVLGVERAEARIVNDKTSAKDFRDLMNSGPVRDAFDGVNIWIAKPESRGNTDSHIARGG
jgi:hypothetical protein